MHQASWYMDSTQKKNAKYNNYFAAHPVWEGIACKDLYQLNNFSGSWMTGKCFMHPIVVWSILEAGIRVTQSCRHCGFYRFSWRRWVRALHVGLMAKQLHRQSVHRQDGLVACICTVCLCLGTHSSSGSSSCPAGYITHCYLCAGLLDWWKPLADCPIPLFPPGWDLLKEKSSDTTLSAFSGSENIPAQEPVFIQGRSYSV